MDESKQTEKPEAINGKIFYGLTWDEPLTQERITYIEDTFGPLAKNLIELAALIRGFDYTTPKGKNDTRWIEIDKNHNWMVSSVMYGPAIRILASAKLLRPVIESAAGGESLARIFYETIITALMGQDVRGQRIMTGAIESTIKSKGEELDKNVSDFMSDLFRQIISFDKVQNRVEPIAQTLEKWDRNDLLIRTGKEGKDGQTTKASGGKADLPNSIPAKIWAMLCKLYEITLKVIVDAILDRFWPKPQ